MPVVTNAELASAVQQVVSRVDAREDQLTAWQAGTPDGGPFADGTYAITNLLGETSYFKSPARLQYEVGLLTTAGTGAVATAEAARDAAEAALASAVVQATNASSSASTASTKASEAQVFRNEAANSEANALAHRNAASASASAAALSEADAEAAAIAAAASASSAAADATSAAASAAAAATFNPANFYTKTQADTLLAAKLATADFSWNNLAGKPATFTPSAHTHAIADVTGLQAALDGKQAAGSYAAAVHGHSIADVTGLQTALDGKQAAGSYAAASHTHVIADVTGLQAALDGKQPAGSYLTGITGSMVTTALGYTPYNATNPNGYITASALSPYALLSGAAFTGAISSSQSITIGSGGTYAAGSIYSDANWGMILRAKQASPNQAQFLWTSSPDNELLRIDNAGNLISPFSVRAPAFYDSQNTAYYLDPASTGTSLLVAGGAYAAGQVRATGWWGGASGSATGLGIEIGQSGGTGYVLSYNRDATTYGPLQFEGTSYNFANVGGSYVTVANSVRSPIFYDSNNTGYYVDPDATSNLNAGFASGQWKFRSNPGSGVYSGATANLGLQAYSDDGGAAQLSFHRSGYYAVNMGLDPDNYLRIGGWSASANRWVLDMSGNNWVANSVRAPTFYDSNNTGYYVDPAGNSVFSSFNIGGGEVYFYGSATNAVSIRTGAGGAYKYFTFDASGNFYALNGSVYGDTFYDQANTAYYANPAGTSNLYTVVTNAQTPAIAFKGDIDGAKWMQKLGGYNLSFMNDGGAGFDSVSFDGRTYYNKFYLDNSGNAYAYSSFRAPIFYDINNTAYYLDPSAGNLSMLIAGRIEGGFGAYSTSGTLDWNDVSNTRSGSTGTLLLGTATNGPGPSIYFHPFNFEYSSKDGTGNVTQMAIAYGSPGNKLYMRGRYSGSWGSWVQFLDTGSDAQYKSGYLESGSSLRAPMFYDSNNTGYYCDPDWYSQFNYVWANNWFRSNGDTGWYNQTYAGGIYMIDTTWVRVYNGKAFYVPNEIAATGNITAYYSDERLKTKTGAIDNALDKVSSLEGFLYVENDLARSLGYSNKKQQVGVSAQAVKAVLPEAVSLAPVDFETLEDGTIVSKSGEEYLTVDYSRIVPLLIEAIKELRAEVEALKNK